MEAGLVLGAFYDGNEGTAIYNSSFRPFTSPVPFLLMRRGVIGDWKFYLEDEEWLSVGRIAIKGLGPGSSLKNYVPCRGAQVAIN